jgi:ribonucleoside-diphosphate reductase alpha chain
MSTSIIDYIFRELAITYLGRHDLAHVIPEDLRADAMHDEDPADGTVYTSEQVISERIVDADEYARGANRLPAPRTSHVKPLKTPNGKPGTGSKPAVAVQSARMKAPAVLAAAGVAAASKPAAKFGTKEDAVRIARQKGYEGDPCGECGALTLVRNGSCLKCDTCGSTSGCS